MEIDSLVNLKMIKNKDKELLLIKMELNFRHNMIKVKFKEK